VAAENRTRFSAGQIERRVCQWGIIFKGRRDALIAAGICNAAPFPGDNGRERTRPFLTKDPSGNQIRISRSGKYNFVVHRDCHSQLEAREWANIERAEQEREEQARQERQETWRREAYPPYDTAAEFRADAQDHFGTITHASFHHLTGGERGWRISEEDHQALVQLRARMLDVVSGARVERTTPEARPKLYAVE
jgi:hypothetical protein